MHVAYRIGDGCLQCGACEVDCENKAIVAKSSGYEIDALLCTECVGVAESPRCHDVCPIELPEPDPNCPETKQQLLEKWRRLHPGREPQAPVHR
jgi:ferredoxin